MQQKLIPFRKCFILDPPACFVKKFLQSTSPYSRIGMYIPLDHGPQTLNPTGCKILSRPCSDLRLVNTLMVEEFFAMIIASPKISIDFSAINDIVSDHLNTSHISPVAHDERPDIFAAPLVKSEHPDNILLTTFGMVSEFRFINFHSFIIMP